MTRPNIFVVIFLSFCIRRAVGDDDLLSYATEYKGKCENTAQCEWLGENSECRYNLCICKEGYRWFQGGCKKFSGFRGTCQDSTDCYDGYNLLALSCDGGVCVCSSDYYDRNGVDCRKIAGAIGDACALDLDCHLNGTICVKEKCQEGERETRTTNDISMDVPHINIIELNGLRSCTTNEDCSSVTNSECHPNMGQCICKHGYFSKNERCIAELGVQTDCTSDSDCDVKPGKCIDGTCYCRDYWFNDDGNRNCVKTMTQNNWNCLTKEWCYALGKYSYCSTNETCECSKISDFDETNYVCLKTGNDTNLCEYDYECEASVKNSECKNEECRCKDNYRVEDGACLPNIGAECDDQDYPCTMENASCSNGVCECVENYITDASKKDACYKISDGLGADCLISEQCIESIKYSVCVNETCNCIEDYTAVQNECYKSMEYGSYCTNLFECTIIMGNTTVCRNSKCQCPVGEIFNGNDCTSSISTIPTTDLWIMTICLIKIVFFYYSFYKHLTL